MISTVYINIRTSVLCSSLADPNNGVINCSLGDDEVPSYEDSCNFTCNTGHELAGSNTRTCQSDGIWSGTNTMCIRGMYHVLYYCTKNVLYSVEVICLGLFH